MSENLPKKAITGVVWNNLSSYFQSLVSFLGVIYLARRIDPIFFGKLGMAAAIVAIVYSLVMWGQEYAIPRQKDNICEYVSMHVFLRVVMTTLIGVVLIALYVFTNLFNNEIFGYIIILFLAQVPLQVTAIYISYMQRELLFGRIAFINISCITFAMLLACTLAFWGYKIWALLWLLMGQYLMQVLLTILLSPKRFPPIFNMVMAREFLQYGKYIFLSNLISRLHTRVDDISVGVLVSNAALGFYQRAYGLGGLLHTIITSGVTSVATPLFAKIREDEQLLGRYFELVSSLLLRLAIGGYVWMAIVLPEVIVLLYGEKWLPTVILFRLMLPYALTQSLNVTLRSTHFIIGDPSRVTRINFISLIILALGLYPLVYLYGTAGAAVAVDIAALVTTGLFFYYLRPIIKFSLNRLFTSPIIAATVGFIGWKVLVHSIVLPDSLSIKILVDSLIFGLIYLGTLIMVEFSYLKNVFIALKRHTLT